VSLAFTKYYFCGIFSFMITPERELAQPEISTTNALIKIARWFPLVSMDSYFGREHAVEYAERLDVPVKDTSMLLSHVLLAPLEKRTIKGRYGIPPRIEYIHRTWKDCFPEGGVEVLPRMDANLPPLPKKLAGTSGAPMAPVNTMAIKVSSICFLANQTDFLSREVKGFGPRRVEQFQNLANLIMADLEVSE
jgi:hypothetical protein